METKIEKITAESLQKAKELISSGEVVAIPTETVYGLGANAYDDEAVKKIFEIKGRPNDNPLIAHVHTDYNLSKIIDYDPPYAKLLRRAFLPGPLTLVYPSENKVSKFVSCGLKTLAVRIPSHEGAQAFLKAVDIPVVAPSANLSRHVSPTSAMHVYDDFEGKIPLILDGGNSVGGIESTVCDVTGEYPVILRPGLITKEMIEKVVGRCEVASELKKGEKAKSPGMLYKHYSPRCKTELYAFAEVEKAKKAVEKAQERIAVLCEEELCSYFEKTGAKILSLGKTDEEIAANLYKRLREAEKVADILIAVEPKKQDGIMAGVMNRLKKACKSEDILH